MTIELSYIAVAFIFISGLLTGFFLSDYISDENTLTWVQWFCVAVFVGYCALVVYDARIPSRQIISLPIHGIGSAAFGVITGKQIKALSPWAKK